MGVSKGGEVSSGQKARGVSAFSDGGTGSGAGGTPDKQKSRTKKKQKKKNRGKRRM